jgi:hypothetical protein
MKVNFMVLFSVTLTAAGQLNMKVVLLSTAVLYMPFTGKSGLPVTQPTATAWQMWPTVARGTQINDYTELKTTWIEFE